MNLGLSENGDRPTIDVVIPAHIYILYKHMAILIGMMMMMMTIIIIINKWI